MAGLGGVQEESRRSGARESCGDLARDVPGLAHAGDHDASVTAEADPRGLREGGPEPRGQRLDRARFDRERTPRGGDQLRIIGKGGRCGRGRRVRIHGGDYGTGRVSLRGGTAEPRLTAVLPSLTIFLWKRPSSLRRV